MKLLKTSGLRFRSHLTLSALSFAILAGCKPALKDSPPPPAVKVATVSRGDPTIYQEWIGTLDGLVNAQIRAQVTGYLLAQDYHEGDRVKKGDLLFEIDARPFQAALDQRLLRLKTREQRDSRIAWERGACRQLSMQQVQHRWRNLLAGSKIRPARSLPISKLLWA